MKLNTKEEKIKWYESEFLSGKKATIIKTKDKFYKFLEDNKLYSLLEKAKSIESLTLIKQDLYNWAFESIPVCKTCGKPVKFVSRSGRYNNYCSYKCSAANDKTKEKRKQTNIIKYGVECSLQSVDVREKAKQTCLEKYGVDNVFKNSKIREKAKQTCLEKYGVDNVFAAEVFKEKIRQTCLERYGTFFPQQTDACKEKIRQTNLKKYGTESSFQNKSVQEKFKQNYLKNHGVDNPFKNPEIKEKIKYTCIEKYGVDNPFQNKSVQEKFKQNYLKNHGVDNPFKNPEIKEKIKYTCIEKYGVDHYSKTKEYKIKMKSQYSEIEEKKYQTKKTNNSFNVSKPEEYIHQKLLEKFSNVRRQYKSEKYPFVCDFYIPDIDLYIEFQGIWTHGNEPFNKNKEEHQNIIKEWETKSNELNSKGKRKHMYENAINVWTIKDPEKRKIAKENNLNWIEFFTLNEFDEWFSHL